LKTRICLLIVVLANAVGNVLLSYGMRQVGSIASSSPLELALSSVRAMANPYVLAGVAVLVVFLLTHMILLSWADLSYILPMTSAGYILVTLLSWWLLEENVKTLRWLGTALIVAGMVLVGGTPVSTTKKS